MAKNAKMEKSDLSLNTYVQYVVDGANCKTIIKKSFDELTASGLVSEFIKGPKRALGSM